MTYNHSLMTRQIRRMNTQLHGYRVVLEQAKTGSWCAYAENLACIAGSHTRNKVKKLMGEALLLHLEAMKEHGDPIPPPDAL